MRKMLQLLDAQLNRLNMYKTVSFSLMSLLMVAIVGSLTGYVGVSALGIIISTLTVGIACFVMNELCQRLTKVPANSESWLITALLLVCILPPATSVTRVGLLALSGALAVSFKYILVVRGAHIFNPAALAACIVGIIGILPATWWVASPVLSLWTALVGLLVLRKTRRFSMFVVFVCAALSVMSLHMVLQQGQPIETWLRTAFLSWPLLFLGVFMLTDPATSPTLHRQRLLFAVIVGSIFGSQLHLGMLSATPQMALLVGNVFAWMLLPSAGAMVRFVRQKTSVPGIMELTFAVPERSGLTFYAGQYMDWTYVHRSTDIRGNRRRFSIVSAPTESELRIAFRYDADHSSSFKQALANLKAGDQVRASRPAGDFTLPTNVDRPLLWIAGGIGITPFVSMARLIVHDRQPRNVIIIFVSHDAEAELYASTFKEAAAYGVQMKHYAKRLDAEQITAVVPDIDRRLVYVSGSEAMVGYYADQLARLGVARADIKLDEFSGY